MGTTTQQQQQQTQNQTTTMDRGIINNAYLLISIDAWLKKENKTREQFETWCREKNVCFTVVSQIKVSPYKFNKDGKYLINLLLDIHTNTVKFLKNKDGQTKVRNTKENQLTWG